MYKKYLVLLTFLDPIEGAFLVPAKDKEDAISKAKEMYSNRAGLKIVDAIDTDQIDGHIKPEEIKNESNIIQFKSKSDDSPQKDKQ